MEENLRRSPRRSISGKRRRHVQRTCHHSARGERCVLYSFKSPRRFWAEVSILPRELSDRTRRRIHPYHAWICTYIGTVTFGSIRSYRHEQIFHSEFECDAKDLALSIKNQPEEQKIHIHGLTRISFQHWKFSL